MEVAWLSVIGKEGRGSSVRTPETPDEAQEDEEGQLPRFKKTTTAWKGKLDGKRQTPEPPAKPWAASVARPLPWGGAVAPRPRDPAAGRSHPRAWAPSTSVARADELRKELKYLDVIQQQRRRSADVTPTPPTPPGTPPLASPAAAAVDSAAGTVPVKPEESEELARENQVNAVQSDAQPPREDSEPAVVQDLGEQKARGVDVREFPVQADDLDDDQESCRSSDVARAEAPEGMVCGDADAERALFLGKASYAGVLAAAEELVAEAKVAVSAAERDVADVGMICEGAREELGAVGGEGEAGSVAAGKQGAVGTCEEKAGDKQEEVVLTEEKYDGEEEVEAAAQSPVVMPEAVVDAEVQEHVAPVDGEVAVEDAVQSPAHGQKALPAEGEETAPGANCTSASRLPKPPTAQGKSSGMESQDKGSKAPLAGASIVAPKAGNVVVSENANSDAAQMCEEGADLEVTHAQTADEEGESAVCTSDVTVEEIADAATKEQVPVETPDVLAVQATGDEADAMHVQEDLGEDGLQEDGVAAEASQAFPAERDDAEVEAAKVPMKKTNVSSMWEAKQAEAEREQALSSSSKPPVNIFSLEQAGGQREEQKDELSTSSSKSPVDEPEPEGAEDGRTDVKMMCKLFARMSENN
ncbi:unnamed protein product [Ostreobium quekettii]|uniref:Uncharacterized protein n=1 Tax=Ostreobium quekettii TaxID=121088 RepID=A0A8S1IRB3_9CHLO|nr:unnamed protein product [Ostreobium quekettii]